MINYSCTKNSLNVCIYDTSALIWLNWNLSYFCMSDFFFFIKTIHYPQIVGRFICKLRCECRKFSFICLPWRHLLQLVLFCHSNWNLSKWSVVAFLIILILLAVCLLNTLQLHNSHKFILLVWSLCIVSVWQITCICSEGSHLVVDNM